MVTDPIVLVTVDSSFIDGAGIVTEGVDAKFVKELGSLETL